MPDLSPPPEIEPRPTLTRRLWRWGRRVRLGDKLAIALTILALCSGVATYVALSNTPFGQGADTVSALLSLDLVLLLLLGAVVSRRIQAIWIKRRRGLAGARLHIRLVATLTVLTVLPAIIVAIFSAVFFFLGVQSWFSHRVSTAVDESVVVATAYLHEHQNVIRADALAMANDLNREAPVLLGSPERFNNVVNTQALLRGLTEALVLDGNGRVLARSTLTFSLAFEHIPDKALAQARQGEVAMITSDGDDRVRALVMLNGFPDCYLFVGRLVDPRVLAHVATAQNAIRDYTMLEGQRSKLMITTTAIFIVAALLLLVVAIWFGLNFATRLAQPISALIAAAERIRVGDLSVRVPEVTSEDELGTLSRAFNRMTSQIETQRTELVQANIQLDQRRRFTETVLAGVSAGVLGLDENGCINLPNRSAAQFLGVEDAEMLVGKRLTDVAPEMGEMLAAIRRRPSRSVEVQVPLRRPGAVFRTLLVRAVADTSGEKRGYVVTFDDVTELLLAQRKAAWADVARRIAHEIKNPLTPIQLAAERLRRRYLKEITSDPGVFITCIDTIIRQVADIGRMVEEFSSFARMPQPVIKPADIVELSRQAVFLQASAHPYMDIRADLPASKVMVNCDSRQISQALTNILKNAVEAVEGRTESSLNPESGEEEAAPASGSDLAQGMVHLNLEVSQDLLIITIDDNGKGLPAEERHRLTEPYVTTRAKGSGLGLAIVKKIMEDHNGKLELADRLEGGARIILTLPLDHPIPMQAIAATAEG